MRLPALALPLLLLVSLPVLAQESPLDPAVPAEPGAVSLYLQAQSLANLAERTQDPLLALAAARILHGLDLTDTPRAAEPATEPQPLAALDAAAVLDLARRIDAGALYPDLIDRLAREVPPAPRALRATAATLAAGKSQAWSLDLFGGVAVELAVVGQGSPSLDTLVAAADDTQICLEAGSASTGFCAFALRENGTVTVTVTNRGAAPASYVLLTE